MPLVKQPFFSMKDKAFNLVGKTQIETETFAGQSGMISVVMGLEAAGWSEPVKGLEAAPWGLERLWWLSSLSQQADHSAAAALSCRVTTCAGQERPCRLWTTQRQRPSDWTLSVSGSPSPFPLHLFHVDLNAAVCLYGTFLHV